MRKSVLILIIRRHAGELDWILPLLYRFKGKYRIISIFSDSGAYESIKRNLNLFKILKEISNEHFIISKKQNFFWKLLRYVLTKYPFTKFNIFLKIEKLINSKTFNINYFLSMFNIRIEDIKAIFVTMTHLSILPNMFKKKNSKILLVRYPESTMIVPSKKENFRIFKSPTYRRVSGDLFLFFSPTNKSFFLGDRITKLCKKKIYYCRMLRYENWWMKKFIKTKKNNNKIFTILVPVRNPNNDFFQRSSYDEIINSIMKIATEYKNCKVIFKIHPQDSNTTILKSLLNKFNKDTWEISEEHVMTLAAKSNFSVSIITSACLDTLAAKIPTVEYYMIDKEINISKKVKSCMHMTFDAKKKKWLTIFNYKRLVNTIFDHEGLRNYFLIAYSNKNTTFWNKNFSRFNKITKHGHDSSSLCSIIRKKIENLT